MKQFTYPENVYPFRHHSMTVEGNKIHYIDEGKGDTILFCHPPVSSSFMYRHMIVILSKYFRCIAIDFPGFGKSQAANEYTHSIKSQSEIFEKVLIELKLTSVYFLMQEVGGHAGLSVFIKHPEWLKGIILTDTIIFPVSQYPRILGMLKFVNGSLFNFFNTDFNLLIRAMTRFGFRKRKLSKDERQTYKAMFNTKQIRRTSTKMLYQLVEEEFLLSQIQKTFETSFNRFPTLLIYGEKDPLAKFKIPQRIKSILSDSELYWIKGETHFPHEGAPEEMSKLIINWLNRKKGN